MSYITEPMYQGSGEGSSAQVGGVWGGDNARKIMERTVTLWNISLWEEKKEGRIFVRCQIRGSASHVCLFSRLMTDSARSKNKVLCFKSLVPLL